MREVKAERTNWRDQSLSNRHRQWGWDCPAVDIDFLMIEYDRAIPVALIEYKAEGGEINTQSTSVKTIERLATRAGIGFYIASYTRTPWTFTIYPLNAIALNAMKTSCTMSEREWVDFLYSLRGRALPDGIAEQLDHHNPYELLRQENIKLQQYIAQLERELEYVTLEGDALHHQATYYRDEDNF